MFDMCVLSCAFYVSDYRDLTTLVDPHLPTKPKLPFVHRMNFALSCNMATHPYQNVRCEMIDMLWMLKTSPGHVWW